MSICLLFLLISSSYGADLDLANLSTKDAILSNKTRNINFKLTKLLDIKIESNSAISDSEANDIIKSNIHENCDGKGNISPEASTTEVLVTHYTGEKMDKNRINTSVNVEVPQKPLSQSQNTCYNKFCETLVGTSKIPPCSRETRIKNFEKVTNIPRSCRDIQLRGKNTSGIYEIQPRTNIESLMVFCDMDVKGGGWTHIQNRFDGSQEFYLGWREYKFGFGDLNGEFWIGLENIYHMTGFQKCELLIELTARDKTNAYAQYTSFEIGPESDGYPMNVLGGYSGDAGDALTYHLGSKFSTKDFDQDKHSTHCAQVYSGAWWYNACHYSSLNGKFINVPLTTPYNLQGIHWNGFKGHQYCLAGSRMLVKPIDS